MKNSKKNKPINRLRSSLLLRQSLNQTLRPLDGGISPLYDFDLGSHLSYLRSLDWSEFPKGRKKQRDRIGECWVRFMRNFGGVN